MKKELKEKIIEILRNSFQFTLSTDGEYPADQILELLQQDEQKLIEEMEKELKKADITSQLHRSL